MKRSDRGRYRAPVRGRGRNRHKSGGSLFSWLIIILIAAGCWYLYNNWDSKPVEEPEESSVSEESETAAADVETEQERDIRPEGTEVPVDTIYRIYDGTMETSEGTYEIADALTLYTKEGETAWENANSLIGLEGISVYLNEQGKASSVYVPKTIMSPDRIRILLANPDGGYYHTAPEITCSTEYWITTEKAIETRSAEEVYTPEGEGRIVLKGATEDAVWNVSGGSFRGSLEIVKTDGGWYIINMLYLEQYLYGVVPSEMPDSFGKEAAKVQAVCSRSFAYTQWRDSTTYAQYGAHMDNTVSSQVYGMTAETENSVAGVEETRGQMLIYDDNVVAANFFSTSCGVTANAGDVWANAKTQEFPTSTPMYLKGGAQYLEGDYSNLSEESAFYNFITNMEIPSYDEESPWYRWSAVISVEGLLDAMLPKIHEISASRPYLVKTLVDDHFEIQVVEGIGTLKNIYVYSRAQSGIITELLIEGSVKTLKISGENSIRKVLAAAGITVQLQDGSERTEQTMLPSAFFSIEKGVSSEGELLQLMIRGGGYGHGVGMSQMGVKGMLDYGYSWDEILKHYYNGIDIEYAPVFQ